MTKDGRDGRQHEDHHHRQRRVRCRHKASRGTCASLAERHRQGVKYEPNAHHRTFEGRMSGASVATEVEERRCKTIDNRQ